MEISDLNRHVWRGLRAELRRATIPTGFADLDRHLPGGGWPRGAIIEIFVDRYGVGELTLLIPALAALTQPSPESAKWVAWIAPPLIPYAPALEQRGVSTHRLLMIHPLANNKDCLWAVEQVLRSGSISGVLAWLAEANDVVLRRLQLAAEERDCWVVLFRPHRALQNRSPAALRIKLTHHAEGICIEVVKCRGGRPGVIDIPLSGIDREPARVSVDSGSAKERSGAR